MHCHTFFNAIFNINFLNINQLDLSLINVFSSLVTAFYNINNIYAYVKYVIFTILFFILFYFHTSNCVTLFVYLYPYL